jgi:hypothetical protein
MEIPAIRFINILMILRNLLPLLLLGLLVQCKKEAYQPVIERSLGDEVTLTVNQQVKLYESENASGAFQLSATLLVVEDQRCPEGVNCVHEGYVRVKLSTIKPNHPEKSLVICWGMCKPAETTPVLFTLGNTEYEATLKDVTPLPQVNSTHDQVKKVTLVIRAL